MDRKEYEKLRVVDVENITWEVRDLIRGKYIDNSLLQTVTWAYLALIQKESKTKESLVTYLDRHVNNETTRLHLRKHISDKSYLDIEKLSNQYDEDTLKAIILFSEPDKFSLSRENSTPEGISKLAISLLEINEDDTVLDLGSGVNSFLIRTGLYTDTKSLYGVEINTESVIVANIRSLITGLPIHVKQGNILSQNFAEIEANKIFSNPPIGMQWKNIEKYIQENKELSSYFKKAKRNISGDWAYALAAINNQKTSGKTITLMSNAGTWNKSDEEIRKKLMEKGLIEGVIELPANLFPSTSVSLTMMVFSEGNKSIRMVDATKIFTEGRRVNTLEDKDISKIVSAYYEDLKTSGSVSFEEIKKQEYILNPHRYVGEIVEIENGIPLGDVIRDIRRGARITSKELDELASTDETNFQYLMLRNIQNNTIDSELPYLNTISENYERYCLKKNDLIISKISPYKVALSNISNDKKILANGNLYMIELDEDKINPTFLELFLQSEKGMEQLNQYAKGTVMKSISIQDLKKIMIPNVSREMQDQIAKKNEILDEELIILQRQEEIIKEKKIKLIQGVF